MTIDDLPSHYRAVLIRGDRLGDRRLVLAWDPSVPDSPVLKDDGGGFRTSRWVSATLAQDSAGYVGRAIVSQWLETAIEELSVLCNPLSGTLYTSMGKKVRSVTHAEALRSIQGIDDPVLLRDAGPGWFIES